MYHKSRKHQMVSFQRVFQENNTYNHQQYYFGDMCFLLSYINIDNHYHILFSKNMTLLKRQLHSLDCHKQKQSLFQNLLRCLQSWMRYNNILLLHNKAHLEPINKTEFLLSTQLRKILFRHNLYFVSKQNLLEILKLFLPYLDLYLQTMIFDNWFVLKIQHPLQNFLFVQSYFHYKKLSANNFCYNQKDTYLYYLDKPLAIKSNTVESDQGSTESQFSAHSHISPSRKRENILIKFSFYLFRFKNFKMQVFT